MLHCPSLGQEFQPSSLYNRHQPGQPHARAAAFPASVCLELGTPMLAAIDQRWQTASSSEQEVQRYQIAFKAVART